MASERRPPAKFVGALAAIIAAVEGAILLGRKTAQAAPTAVVGLTKEVIDLLIAMAGGIGSIIEKLDEVIAAIKALTLGGGLGYPLNADTFVAQFVPCPFPQPQTYHLPPLDIPTGMTLQLLARNPLGVNVGIIWVSPTEPGAGQPTQSWPLIPGATLGLTVKNAGSVYISATVAGEGIYIAVEQNKG